MANYKENVSIFWDSPVNADGTLYSHIKAYELHHTSLDDPGTRARLNKIIPLK